MLQHESIIQTYSIFVKDSQVFQMVDPTLRRHLGHALEDHPSLPLRDREASTAIAASGILGALSHLHGCGLAHRDVKPEVPPSSCIRSSTYSTLLTFSDLLHDGRRAVQAD